MGTSYVATVTWEEAALKLMSAVHYYNLSTDVAKAVS